MQKTSLITYPQITLSWLIEDNYMGIMFVTSLWVYCQGRTQPSIVSLKVLRMIGKQEEKSYQENLLIMLLRSATPR